MVMVSLAHSQQLLNIDLMAKGILEQRAGLTQRSFGNRLSSRLRWYRT